MATWTFSALRFRRALNGVYPTELPSTLAIDLTLTGQKLNFTIGEQLILEHDLSADTDLRGKRIFFRPALWGGVGSAPNENGIRFDIPIGATAGDYIFGQDCMQQSARNQLVAMQVTAASGASFAFTLHFMFFATMDMQTYLTCAQYQNHDRLLKKVGGMWNAELDADTDMQSCFDDNTFSNESYGAYRFELRAIEPSNNNNIITPVMLPSKVLRANGAFYNRKHGGAAAWTVLDELSFWRNGVQVSNLSTEDNTKVYVKCTFPVGSLGLTAYLIRTDTFNNALSFQGNYMMSGNVITTDAAVGNTIAQVGTQPTLVTPSSTWQLVAGTQLEAYFHIDKNWILANGLQATWRVVIITYDDTNPQDRNHSFISDEVTVSNAPVTSTELDAEMGLFNLLGGGELGKGIVGVCVQDRILAQVKPPEGAVTDWLSSVQESADNSSHIGVDVITIPEKLEFEIYDTADGSHNDSTKNVYEKKVHQFNGWGWNAALNKYVAQFTGYNGSNLREGVILPVPYESMPHFTSVDGQTMDDFLHMSYGFRIRYEGNIPNIASYVNGVAQSPVATQDWTYKNLWVRVTITFRHTWVNPVNQTGVLYYTDTYNWHAQLGTIADPIAEFDNISEEAMINDDVWKIDEVELYMADRVTPLNYAQLCAETTISVKVTLRVDEAGGKLAALIDAVTYGKPNLEEEESFDPNTFIPPQPKWLSGKLLNVDTDFTGTTGVAWFDVDLTQLTSGQQYRVTALRLTGGVPVIPTCSEDCYENVLTRTLETVDPDNFIASIIYCGGINEATPGSYDIRIGSTGGFEEATGGLAVEASGDNSLVSVIGSTTENDIFVLWYVTLPDDSVCCFEQHLVFAGGAWFEDYFEQKGCECMGRLNAAGRQLPTGNNGRPKVYLNFRDDTAIPVSATWVVTTNEDGTGQLQSGTATVVDEGSNHGVYAPDDGATTYLHGLEGILEAWVWFAVTFDDAQVCYYKVHLVRASTSDPFLLATTQDYTDAEVVDNNPDPIANACEIYFDASQINQLVAGESQCSASWKFCGVPVGVTASGTWWVSDSLFGVPMDSGAFDVTTITGCRWANTHLPGNYTDTDDVPDVYFWGTITFDAPCGTLCMYAHLTWDGNNFTLADYGLVDCDLIP